MPKKVMFGKTIDFPQSQGEGSNPVEFKNWSTLPRGRVPRCRQEGMAWAWETPITLIYPGFELQARGLPIAALSTAANIWSLKTRHTYVQTNPKTLLQSAAEFLSWVCLNCWCSVWNVGINPGVPLKDTTSWMGSSMVHAISHSHLSVSMAQAGACGFSP